MNRLLVIYKSLYCPTKYSEQFFSVFVVISQWEQVFGSALLMDYGKITFEGVTCDFLLSACTYNVCAMKKHFLCLCWDLI